MKSLGGNGIFIREVWFEESGRSRFHPKSESEVRSVENKNRAFAKF
jgi:hypothetical protein